MANSKLEGKYFPVPEEYHTYLGSKISYPNLKMNKTRLNQAKDSENFQEFNRRGGEEVLNWIDEILKKERDAIYNVKKIGMESGRENQFIRPHEKDRENKNPTKVGGLPKINKGKISRKIMTNKEVYNESKYKEINKIIYLIEYMNNNKKENL